MIRNEWRHKPKRWGHPLHSVCPGPTGVAPRLAHWFIQKFTEPGDVVLDPFRGSGSVVLQACLEGRLGVGLDPDPLAHALTRAKAAPPELLNLRNRVDELSVDMFFSDTDAAPEAIRRAFHPETLRQLIHLRELLNPADRVDSFIIAVLLGILRGADKRSERRGDDAPLYYLSPAESNTFSANADFPEGDGSGGQKARRDVFLCLRARLEELIRRGLPQTEGRAWFAPVRDIPDLPDPALRKREVRLILGAPPPPRAIPPDEGDWLRLWFLRQDRENPEPKPGQRVKLGPWLDQMESVCANLYRVGATGAVCALVLGDIRIGNRTVRLAEKLWERLEQGRSRWLSAGIVEDGPRPSAATVKLYSSAELPFEPDGEQVADPAIVQVAEPKAPARRVDRVLVLHKREYRERVERVTW